MLAAPALRRHSTISSACAASTQISSFSMASFSCWIWFFSWLPSLVVTLHAITGRDTPHARPSAALEGTKT